MFSTRWSPWNEVQSDLSRLQHEMNSLFGRYGATNGNASAPRSFPALNIWEDDEQLTVQAELPGMDLGDLEIYVNGTNELSINGERKVPGNQEGKWRRRERGYGKFSRVLQLPVAVDANKVQASFADGVLSITMPKHEASKPRKIEVKSE